jgi:DNA ligase D-like protein (predicted ligase)
VKTGKKVDLISRNGKLLTSRFPGVGRALSVLVEDFAIDGEIVALDEQGRPDFQLLQNSRSNSAPISFYAFDVLNVGGRVLLLVPFDERRELLEILLQDAPEPVRLSPILSGSPGKILAAVRQLGLEGVVGKKTTSLYEPGERSGAWIKHRTNREQEFVIGGYIPGSSGFDSLVVGFYEKGKLRYCAKVKNGFVPRLRAQIAPKLKRLRTDECPFFTLPEPKGGRWGEPLTKEKMGECVWVKPKLVCRVEFVEWTNAQHLRHSHFVAMRDDKESSAVNRET